ncbi:MAG: T9SS type A sorting domain-containing protein [Bacteroidota bacterium]
MKRICLLLFLPILFSQNIFSQGVNNVWITGYFTWAPFPWGNTVTDFSSGGPISVAQNMNLSFMRTNASIADTAGNLLFYTNGFNVCNALGEVMPNGSGLDSSDFYSSWYEDGMPNPQGALIIPYPSHPDSFFLIHQTADYVQFGSVLTVAPFELYYSIIDMTLDSGRGDLVERQVTFLENTLQAGRLTACKHANGRDWWLVTRKCYSDIFYTFLITPDGISSPLTQQIGDTLQPPDIGQVCFSPQGDKYALVDHLNGLRLFDFDRCTGIFSNPIYIPLDSDFVKGVAFSPNGQFLYVTNDTCVYQYNMWSSNIDSSKLTVALWDSTYSPQWPSATTFYTPQLGPDGKIYISCGNGSDVMHVINQPDSSGIACDVCQHCITLPTYNSFGCVPNHPNYFLGAETGSICDSLTVNSNQNFYSENIPLKIYPNPAQNFFWIDYYITNSTTNGELIMFNTLGEVVMRKTLFSYFRSAKVECKKLLQGVYYVSIIAENKMIASGKFVKQ